MIQLLITKQGKSYSPRSNWATFDNEMKNFVTMQEAMTWLKEEYGKCKRVRMYVDDKNGKARHIGYIYSFHNSDISHSPIEKWIEQDWIEFRSTKTVYFD